MRSITHLLDEAYYYLPDPVGQAIKPLCPHGAALRRQLYAMAPQYTVETEWGVRMRVDPSNYVERTLADGRFERKFLQYVNNRLDEWNHFVDIGANIGFFSLFVGNRNNDCRVDAFEPAPHNLTRLIENVRLNPAALNINGYAVGDYNGEINLQVSRRHPGETTVAGTPKSESETETVITTVRRLDDCLDEHPDVIKLDIEGAEVAALRGANSVLSETPELLLELHPSNIQELGEDQTEVVDTLSDHGYTNAVRIEDGSDLPLSRLGNTTREHTHYHITRRCS
ncbi:hypothetical protein GCM10027355_36580 [Haloplanus salinarum]|uniref:FkbM family methyltransferase n=1 Tax=Haloplanus salinarum TaxID=1912324 RepID=UPI003B43694E